MLIYWIILLKVHLIFIFQELSDKDVLDQFLLKDLITSFLLIILMLCN